MIKEGTLICVCDQAQDNCEKHCERWEGKDKPVKVYQCPSWKGPMQLDREVAE